MAQRHIKQKLQACDGGVEGDGRGSRVHQVELIEPKIFRSGRVRGASQVLCKSADRADIGLLCLGRELAHAHVLQHALAQWRYWLA